MNRHALLHTYILLPCKSSSHCNFCVVVNTYILCESYLSCSLGAIEVERNTGLSERLTGPTAEPPLGKFKFVVYIGCVFISLSHTEPCGCQIRAHGGVILGDPSALVSSKGIAAKVRVLGVQGRLDLPAELRRCLHRSLSVIFDNIPEKGPVKIQDRET